DVSALDTFKYPAARVKPSTGTSIATIDDLLNGLVKEANQHAMACGVIVGMTGREAADLLS
ncbi:MAG: YunC family protein, partial [Methanomicrobiales archaeon]|nr:YunC family protein [Methanomicrobiales archaeon]